jgi:hypothetical protein
MEIEDLIIETETIGWQECLQPWGWLLKKNPQFEIWLVTLFGELIITDDNGEVWFLSTSKSTYEKVADSEAAFVDSLSDPEVIESYFMPQVATRLKNAGMTLAKGECYGFHVPPVLQESTLEPENFKCVSVEEYLKALGGLLSQLNTTASSSSSPSIH